MLAHLPLDPSALWQSFAQFGTDWLHVAVPVLVAAVVVVWLTARGRSGPGRGPVVRFADGAGSLLDLPGWCAAPLVVLVGWSLPMAASGFFWDVAWHIDIGRDEFLLSPPHVFLLFGVGSFWVAGALAIYLATRLAAPVVWRVGAWRVPSGGAALLVAGGVAVAGWGIDELWHAAYGLDVTMWSPPHLMMIMPAVLVPMGGWILLAEAGVARGRSLVQRVLLGLMAGILLTSTSALQLEYDLGVPQWQGLYQPVLIALAGGFTLVAARAALGRGGALIAVAGFLAIRGVTTLLTTQLWELTEPRFPLYLAAAVAVEVVAWLRERHTTSPAAIRRTDALSGLAVGTVGLVGAGLWTHVWAYHPWSTGMLPAIGVATLGAVGAALLGGPFGRVVTHRPAVAGPAGLVLGAVLIAVAGLFPLPRVAPDAEVTVQATPVADGRAEVTVEVDPPELIDRPQRWEIMSWQGGASEIQPLEEIEPGVWSPEGPVPVDGTWKSMVRFNDGADLGAVPIFAPADPEIDAPEIPVQDVRQQAFQDESELLLREAHDGPAWPGIVAYAALYGGVTAILALLVAGGVALERRRRGQGPAVPPTTRPDQPTAIDGHTEVVRASR